VVLRGSENYLPHLALYVSLLLYFCIACEIIQLGGSRWRISSWIWLRGKPDGSNNLVKELGTGHDFSGWN